VLHTMPQFDDLRGDARFDALVAEIERGAPEAR
jgi:hypothetical protein